MRQDTDESILYLLTIIRDLLADIRQLNIDTLKYVEKKHNTSAKIEQNRLKHLLSELQNSNEVDVDE